MKKNVFIMLSCITAVILYSCDAPRNNPLDPISDEKPSLSNFQLYSEVINRYGTPAQQYYVIVKALMKDKNQVIDTVYIESQFLKQKRILTRNSDLYETSIELKDGKLFEDLVGRDFLITAKDFTGRVMSLGTSNIKRVLKNDIKPVSPLNSEIVFNPCTLKWEKFEGQFSFSYKVQVVVDEFNGTVIWQKENIHPDSTSITIDYRIPAGEYFWVVWGIDQFQNRTRSKEAKFIIE